MLRRLGTFLVALAVALVVTAGATPAPARSAPAAAPAQQAATTVQRTVVIGQSVRGRSIRAYYRGDPRATRVLLVLGQMHGDESAGRSTVGWVWQHVRPRAGTGLWVIPSINPDGAARHRRTNARGVDLNRNWPTSGWRRTAKGSRYYGGPRPGSEPETKALMRFLAGARPNYVASIHQPLHGVGRSGPGIAWERRLARNLALPLRSFGVGNPTGTVSPTMTGWYNQRYRGIATTIEYGARPSTRFRTVVAGRGIARAAGIY
ncbi:DUF2817 domain-containing protein [Nocardioides sp. LML1-1-1.1]|uniref:DUF2817 domain-containing protein n=1 Tax=Nocardioides sp. LML1-1-1.1 TaxID=3135248 RepID=UPI00343D67F5